MSLFGNLFSGLSSFGENNITWYCDGCNSILNSQEGFSRFDGTWVCTECGYENDVTDNNVFQSEEEYQASMGIPRCPYCDGIVQGDAPDATYFFNCCNCNERFYFENGELISIYYRSRSTRKCENCGSSLGRGEYTAPWENGNNPNGYIKCPSCGFLNFEYSDD